MPFDLYKVIEHAHNILLWQENLTEEETPPEWMWSVDHELEVWFEQIKVARDEKYGAHKDEVPMMTNEHARNLREVR